MTLFKIRLLLLSMMLILAADETLAQKKALSSRTLIVGTKVAPPFSIKTSDGAWTGISIDLWKQIAAELKLAFELQESDLQGLIHGVANRSLNVAVAALTVTPEREKMFDFTHPFYSTGLGIAAAVKEGSPWLAVFKRFLSSAFLKAVAALAMLLLAVGIIVWWFERKKNPQQFGKGTAHGVWSGFWWSAVTMTTVGYGDKAPVTLGGRIVALVWMFTAIIVISSMTAAITSALTVTQLKSPIRGPEDLSAVRVGTVDKSTSEFYLKGRHISFRPYKTAMEGLKGVEAGEIQALVYDAPILRYLINENFKGTVRVLPHRVLRQDYAIALTEGSLLREPINRVLLEKIRETAWQDTLHHYLGE